MTTPNVELRIGRLVLDGFAPGDRAQIGAAVERELMRLLAERGLPPALAQGGAIPHLDGASIAIEAGSRAEAIGVQVARAVYGGLSR
jgi:hypothetical protein